MSDKKYRVYSEAFILEALALLKSSAKSASQIERDLGITPGMLLKWHHRYEVVAPKGQESALKLSHLEATKREARHLQREINEIATDVAILKKSSSYFLPKKRMKYIFIAAQEDQFQVNRMCSVLGVGRSGYYAWRKRTPVTREQAGTALLKMSVVKY
jgi:putative transposase